LLSRFLVLLLLSCLASPLSAREVDLTLVAVGDVAMNRTKEDVHPDGILLWGKLVPFSKLSDGIRKQINGDLNFLNLETTIMAPSRRRPTTSAATQTA
jgi:hypothetical protein